MLGLRTGIGLLVGLMVPILYIAHDEFRGFVNEFIDRMLLELK
jgi:hypothetical protein